jgi:hypothetical protein
MKEEDIRAMLDNYVDTPDWEKDPNDPAPAISHQSLVSIAATTGLRSVMIDRIEEMLAKHDNIKDLDDDLEFLRGEICDDLQNALHGTSLGEECQAHEMEWSLTLEALRKEKQ